MRRLMRNSILVAALIAGTVHKYHSQSLAAGNPTEKEQSRILDVIDRGEVSPESHARIQ